MAGRKAPRPLPRPVRWLAMFLALVFVVSLGMVVNHESSKATGGASDASSSTPAKSPKRKKTAKTGGYGGLKAGGIPTPGDWSRQRVLSIVKEQQGDERKVSMKPVGGKGGPVDVALDTVDRILDPTPSDEEWNDTMQQLFQPDIAGQSHGPSNMARYWWSQRRLNPDLLCTGRQSDNLIIQSYDCSTDRTYQGDADGIVKDTQSWMQGSDRVFFDIPGSIGSSIASSTDPQSVISLYYDGGLPRGGRPPVHGRERRRDRIRVDRRRARRHPCLARGRLRRSRHEPAPVPSGRDHRRRTAAVLVHRRGRRERLTCPAIHAAADPGRSTAACFPSSPCCASS